MHIFCDESGNTGLDLLNVDQRVFALASTNLGTADCRALLTPLLRQKQKEAKYARLKGSRAGQQALVTLFSAAELTNQTAKFYLADKRYYVITHLVDKLIEPTLHKAGIDLYDGDAHVSLANVWFYAGHTIFPNGGWQKILGSFVRTLRERSKDSYAEFDATLTRAAAATPIDSRDFAVGLLLARGRLEEFIGAYEDSEVFDPAVDAFVALINSWMATDEGRFAVTHDKSKPLRKREAFLRFLMAPASPRITGYGKRQAELPLRISNLNFGDSVEHPQLQLADLIAGASIDCLLAWSGKRSTSDYHQAMRETSLPDLFVGGMLPSPEIERVNERRPGELSLVDGATQFLKEVGYFDASKRSGE